MKILMLRFFILHPSSFILSSRAGGIRTRDLLNPIQAHYQAVLRPAAAPTIDRGTFDCQITFPSTVNYRGGSRDSWVARASRALATMSRRRGLLKDCFGA